MLIKQREELDIAIERAQRKARKVNAVGEFVDVLLVLLIVVDVLIWLDSGQAEGIGSI